MSTTEEQKKRRRNRLQKRHEQILSLRDHGYEVVEWGAGRYLVNKRLVLIPLHNEFIDMQLQQRGNYGMAKEFVIAFFRRVEIETRAGRWTIRDLPPPASPKFFLLFLRPGLSEWVSKYEEWRRKWIEKNNRVLVDPATTMGHAFIQAMNKNSEYVKDSATL